MILDTKFEISATSKKGVHYDNTNSVLFLAKDRAFLLTLDDYIKHCVALGADENQIKSATLLRDRVKVYQETHFTKVPDTNPIIESDCLK